MARGVMDETQDLLEKSLLKFTKSADLHYRLARVYRSKKLRKEARQEARRTLELVGAGGEDEIDAERTASIEKVVQTKRPSIKNTAVSALRVNQSPGREVS